MDNYDDIKHLSRPQYEDFPPMTISDRAAQFSPFAALVGYDDTVAETVRFTDSRKELADDEENELNDKLKRLAEILDERPTVKVTYFVPDKRKSGGSYTVKTGVVQIINEYERALVFTDGEKIYIDDISALILKL